MKINFLPLVLGVSFATVAIIVFGASKMRSPVEKDPEFKKTKCLEEITAEGFEIRLQNEQDNERLELTQTLDEALAYLKRYSMHHEDLFVYDLTTGAQVASSANGSGVIYTGTN
jgi:wyosine [tRNA(Phe)-imidazoG37] synthetase (radical SAM superfamily)